MQRIDYIVLVIVAILMMIGAVFSFSLPTFLESVKHLSKYHFVERYLVFSFVGFVIMIGLSLCNPEKCFDILGKFLFFTSGIAILVMAFGHLPESIVPTINGAKRWINLGFIKIAPVEFFKIGMIYFLASSFTRKISQNHPIREEIEQIGKYMLVLGIAWIIILKSFSDLGQVIVMGLIFSSMLYVAGGKSKTVGLLVGLALVVFILAVMTSKYRLERFKGWLATISANLFHHPLVVDTANHYYQVKQSLNAIYHGGIFGVGLGNGVFKLGFLSDVHTDFVLSGIAEEGGVVAIFIIVFLFIFLIYRLIRIANRSEKKEYQLFIFGVASMITFQFVINGLGVTSIIPIKGLTVPFLSYGGSSLISMCIGIGMVLMLSKRAKL